MGDRLKRSISNIFLSIARRNTEMDAQAEEQVMHIPKLLVLITVHAMCAIGLALLWNDRRKSPQEQDNAAPEEGRVPVFK